MIAALIYPRSSASDPLDTIVVSLPVVVAFLAMQRFIVGGLTAGGVK